MVKAENEGKETVTIIVKMDVRESLIYLYASFLKLILCIKMIFSFHFTS